MSKKKKKTLELEEINIRKGHLWQIDTATKKHKKKKGKGSYNRKEAKAADWCGGNKIKQPFYFYK